MNVHTAVSKGKRKVWELNGDDGQLKPPLKCLVNLDFEESHLEIWKDAARRRGGHYQHLEDAPRLLRDLVIWLESVVNFQKMTKLKCPDFSFVRALVGPRWAGRWTPKALLAFQAVANCTGIMHPPRNQNGIRTWRTHGNEVCAAFRALHPRRNLKQSLPIPPSMGSNRKFPNVESSGIKNSVTSWIYTPPLTPPVRAHPFGRVRAYPGDLRTGGNISRARPGDLRIGGPSADGGAFRGCGCVGEQTGNQVAEAPRHPASAAGICSWKARVRGPHHVFVLPDSSGSEEDPNSTSAVAGSFVSARMAFEEYLESEDEATTSVSTQGSACRAWYDRAGRRSVCKSKERSTAKPRE